MPLDPNIVWCTNPFDEPPISLHPDLQQEPAASDPSPRDFVTVTTAPECDPHPSGFISAWKVVLHIDSPDRALGSELYDPKPCPALILYSRTKRTFVMAYRNRSGCAHSVLMYLVTANTPVPPVDVVLKAFLTGHPSVAHELGLDEGGVYAVSGHMANTPSATIMCNVDRRGWHETLDWVLEGTGYTPGSFAPEKLVPRLADNPRLRGRLIDWFMGHGVPAPLSALLARPQNPPGYEDWQHRQFRQRRGARMELGTLIRQWHNAWSENGGDDGGYIGEVDELIDILDDCAGDGSPYDRDFHRRFTAYQQSIDIDNLRRLSCGHWANESGHRIGGRYGTTYYCDDCFEIGREDGEIVYVVDDDRYHFAEDVHLWNSDDEWHLDPDPVSDDDDDDEPDGDPDLMLDYSSDALDYLAIDDRVETSQHGDFLMGVELEMQLPGHPNDYIEAMRSELKGAYKHPDGEAYAVFKYDGSLPSDGAEMVTCPTSLAAHRQVFEAWSAPKGTRAWDPGSCGMHVHIDSRAFSALTLGKFMMFINLASNADFIHSIAGRHPSRDRQAESYCRAEDQAVLKTPAMATKGADYSRYRMVNLQNLGSSEAARLHVTGTPGHSSANTVELRVFRASLKRERLLAQLEFTHAAVMFCRVASWSKLSGDDFRKWLRGTTYAYPWLAKWLGIVQPRAALTTETADHDDAAGFDTYITSTST